MGVLSGKRILVLEDEVLIAFLLEDMLIEFGCIVLGPATDISSAERLARKERIDAAVLDLNIGGKTSHSVASVLQMREIPYLLASGYGDGALPPGAGGLLNKPYRPEDLRMGLERLFV